MTHIQLQNIQKKDKEKVKVINLVLNQQTPRPYR